ncbi:unnamed protein product [Cylindrotheca closterium]|uniref:Uncharacterized protein n=1 Tax=Cylindrotheca closterium TaxID=2856 RepID=A0AAD2FQN0_9STRA|nr:unnamed protein product [Cylindrotheca closterium]
MTGPTFVPVNNNDMEVNKHTPMLDESTDLESEESSRNGTPNSSRVEPEEQGGFDFATFACCTFGATRGTCPLCHQVIGMSDAFCNLRGPDPNGQGEILAHMECFHRQQRAKAHNATKIQALARGGRARDDLRRERAAREAAARRAFELEREAERAAELAAMEADREQAPKKKKSLAKKLFGCFGSKPAVEEREEPRVTFEDDDSTQ